MSDTSDPRSLAVMEEVIAIWRDVDPVECYAAGLTDDCKGKLFFPTQTDDILQRIEKVRPDLADIQDPELRSAAEKLFDCISVALKIESPDQQVLVCFLAIWYAILKEEETEDFVGRLLDQAVDLMAAEHTRWRGRQFTGETRKAVVDACSALESILIILASKNDKVTDAIGSLSATVADFRSLFSFPVKEPGNLDELFEFFRANSGAKKSNELYPQILAQLLDYGASSSEIYARAQELLETELPKANELVVNLSGVLDIPEGASLGDAYDILKTRYQITGSVVDEARKMMDVLNDFVDENIQDIGVRPDILPDATPNFLKSLITSGGAIALNYLKPHPSIRIFVTEEKNTSFLTLLNVLVHEATHAYSPQILSDIPSLPMLTKIKSFLSLPFYEATAFHRELELFEAVSAGAGKTSPSGPVLELLGLFDLPKFPLPNDVMAFELETRIWRIIRAVRTICDVEINTGVRTYVDFVEWAVEHTGLSRDFVHDECFPFLSYPGYTPSYSFCGTEYQRLQQEALQRGVERFDFNSQANRMGVLPWTLCVARLSALGRS